MSNCVRPNNAPKNSKKRKVDCEKWCLFGKQMGVIAVIKGGNLPVRKKNFFGKEFVFITEP